MLVSVISEPAETWESKVTSCHQAPVPEFGRRRAVGLRASIRIYFCISLVKLDSPGLFAQLRSPSILNHNPAVSSIPSVSPGDSTSVTRDEIYHTRRGRVDDDLRLRDLILVMIPISILPSPSFLHLFDTKHDCHHITSRSPCHVIGGEVVFRIGGMQ
jgi:hypothetical protein